MRPRLLALIVLFCGFAGCGDGIKRVPVQGRVTAKGEPLDGTLVQFVPAGATKGEGGLGYSDKDGNYSLSGLRGAKGIVAGDYKVRLIRLVGPDGAPLPADADPVDTPGSKESLPRQYTAVEATPLKATVGETGATVNIDLPTGLPRRKR